MIINGREIGAGKPPYIIAEISCNHGGYLDRALQLIWWAKYAGADIVKFQCYEPQAMTIDCDRDDFIMKEGPWQGAKLWDLYREASTPYAWFPKIAAKAKELKMPWFASVFDKRGVDVLEACGVPAFKIASFEITDIPLIKYAASKGKPMILSTGMASYDEIIEAKACVPPAQRAVLQCVSAYPARIEDYDLSYYSSVLHGISDHTLGHDLAVAATARGARIIEKHLCLARELGGPDAGFSTEPHEFKKMVQAVRATWGAIQPKETGTSSMEETSRQARRSLYCVKDIGKGQVVHEEHVRSVRPGYGLSPKEFDKVVGKKVARDVGRGEALTWEMFE